jgi:hypothetical protein
MDVLELKLFIRGERDCIDGGNYFDLPIGVQVCQVR